jgi:tetratricopeptide (TPR) repeat protein
MGEVYEAEQDRTGRRVAVKVVRPEMLSADLARRFEYEVRVLARLQHPGIAQVFEAGRVETPAGQTPYFAMEYVEGKPLTTYVKEKGLGLRERLGLFLKVCDAVEHAHRMGVIHRDLKPENILVDAAGQPRILDFGVARATDADVQTTTMHTEVGRVLGTLPYMSPEQVVGDPDALDTRSDVYSLGVVLYELLAGRLPYEISRSRMHEAARVIKEEEPARLGTIDRVYRGDLETIAGKALEKEKGRRYQSVGELSADVKRYLADEAILARRPTASYRVSKFISRNRGLSLGILLTFGALTAGLAGTSWQAVRATRARNGEAKALVLETQRREEAEQASKVASDVVQFVRDLMAEANPGKQRKDVTIRDVLMEVARKSEPISADPEVDAAIRLTVGSMLGGLGVQREALIQIQSAMNSRLALLGRDDRRSIEAEIEYVASLNDAGVYEDALDWATRALEDARRVLGPGNVLSIRAASARASSLAGLGRLEQARDEMVATLSVADGTPGLGPRESLTLRSNLGGVCWQLNKHAEARHHWLETLEGERRVYGENSVRVLMTRGNLVMLLLDEQRYEEAAAELTQLQAALRELVGAADPRTLNTSFNLGVALLKLRRLDEAEAIIRENVDQTRAARGDDHEETLMARGLLAEVLDARGRYAEADVIQAEVVGAFRRTLGEVHPLTITSMYKHASIIRSSGDFARAAAMTTERLDLCRRELGQENNSVVTALRQLADIACDTGDFGKAEPLYRSALEIALRIFPRDHPGLPMLRDGHARALLELGRLEEAMAVAQAGLPSGLPPGASEQLDPGTLRLVRRVVQLYTALNRPEEAARYRALAQPDTIPEGAPKGVPAPKEQPAPKPDGGK